MLRGFLGCLGVVRLNRGDRDVGLNAGVEGDDRDALAVDLVQESAAAAESSAAKPMAAGPESRADLSWSVCSVTLVSSCGPTKLTL